MFGNPIDGTYQMIARGSYGDFVMKSLQEAPSEAHFLDFGANIGLFSIALASHFSQRVTAFEPNTESFRYLQKNLEHHNLPDVQAICAGLHEFDRPSATIQLRRFHSGAASIVNQFGWRKARISMFGPMMIESTIPVDRPLVGKIDVEGAELSVVKCLDKAGILNRFERIVIEMSLGTNDQESLREIRKALQGAGLFLQERNGSDHFGDELFVRT